MHDRDRRRVTALRLLPLLVSCGLLIAAAFAGTNVAAGAVKAFSADTYSTTTDTSTPTTTTDETTPTTPPTTTTTPTTPPTTTTTPPPPGGEGCTPGFWKNHPEAWAGTGFSPTQTLGSVFTGLPASYASITLFDALSLMGGGIEALLRQAVAALLNAASPDVDYPLTVAQVIAMTNAAIASGDYETTKDLFDELNNLTAPGFCD